MEVRLKELHSFNRKFAPMAQIRRLGKEHIYKYENCILRNKAL